MQADGIASAVLFFSLLSAASLWDIRKRIIPDTVCALLFAAGLLCFDPVRLLGALIALPLLIAALVKEGGMGGGDIKLTAAAGAVLGFGRGTAGLIFGLSAVLLYHLAAQSVRNLKRSASQTREQTALPLAPFLSLGFIAAYFINFGG